MFLKSSNVRHIPFDNKTTITKDILHLTLTKDTIDIVGEHTYFANFLTRDSRSRIAHWPPNRIELEWNIRIGLVISHCLGDVSWGVTNASSKAAGPKDIPGYLGTWRSSPRMCTWTRVCTCATTEKL